AQAGVRLQASSPPEWVGQQPHSPKAQVASQTPIGSLPRAPYRQSPAKGRLWGMKSGSRKTLRAASEPSWSHAVGHHFVKELFGAVPDALMARYLVQEPPLPRQLLTLFGAALASADPFEPRLRFGRFIGMVSGEDNT